MEHSKEKFWALHVVSCQKDRFIFKDIPKILKKKCNLKTKPVFRFKKQAAREIAECLSNTDNKEELMQVLGGKKHRAWRCTFKGIREIYKSLVRDIPDEDCERWAEQLASDITSLFTKTKMVTHWAIAGASGAGKTTAYQLAYHMVLHGYFQVKDTHTNDKLQELLEIEETSISAFSVTWTKDCKNDPRDENASLYSHVSKKKEFFYPLSSHFFFFSF